MLAPLLFHYATVSQKKKCKCLNFHRERNLQISIFVFKQLSALLLTIRYPSYQSYDKYCQTKASHIPYTYNKMHSSFLFTLVLCRSLPTQFNAKHYHKYPLPVPHLSFVLLFPEHLPQDYSVECIDFLHQCTGSDHAVFSNMRSI